MIKHPRREGLFDGRLVGRIGRVAWDLEQSAAREAKGLNEQDESLEDLQVPEHARLVSMDIEYATDDERRARVKLANAVEMQMGEGTIVDIEF